MQFIDSGFDATHCSGLFDLFAHTPDLVAMFDTDDCLVAANPAYCATFHADPSRRPVWRDIMRANHENKRGPVIETDNIESWLTIADARRGTVPYRAFEAELRSGNWAWITETVSPAGLMLFYASEITALRRGSRGLRLERDAARRASWTDPLTGVPNRRYIMDRLEEWMALQRIQPEFGTHTLAVIDLDHFKQINDEYGHDRGDEILVAFCRKVVSLLRSFDLFGRIGGEEFLLLMQGNRVWN
ncbi:MAG: GGDEF domain-containing protein [Alphaproteobacteria bacterium]|nr:GGDEF domain-containing protein [Alphaproteobacteria bacterium]